MLEASTVDSHEFRVLPCHYAVDFASEDCGVTVFFAFQFQSDCVKFFHEVKVVDESLFPIDCIANDPTARVIINKLNIAPSEIEDISNSVASIKVQGIKPA